jgi:prevent-host-death family protein
VEASVGIRKLRDGLTRYLGRVRRGEQLVITDRGAPVAVLLPYRRDRARSRTERLDLLLGKWARERGRATLPEAAADDPRTGSAPL